MHASRIFMACAWAALILLSPSAQGQPKKPIGAEVPWLSYHAVDGATNGQKLTSRSPTEIANEAIKRSCVKLAAAGQSVQWKITKPANAIVIRTCVPDSLEGGGARYTISLSINGKPRQKLTVSSHHSWLYGAEPNPQKNSPAEGTAHMFFDESRALLEGEALKAGDTVRVSIEKGDTAPWCMIDLMDLENVDPPAKMPEGFLSVLDFGAIANDDKDDTAAFKACVEKAKADGKGVWIPEGTFHQSEQLIVNQVKVRGAGPWHTRLTAIGLPTKPEFGGNMGFRLAGNDSEVADLAIDGILTSRAKPFQHGFTVSSNAPDRFRIENVWIEHTNTGGWIGPCSNGIIRRCRIRNTYADGLNINSHSHDLLVEHCHCRGTGDDSLAVFAGTEQKGADGTCEKMTLRHNTVEGPWWGNGIAVYGGTGIVVEQNLIAGANRGTGLFLSSGFKSWPGDGIRVSDNLLVDCGGTAQNQGWAAMQIYIPGKDLKGVVIQGNTIRRATSDAFKIQGNKTAPGVIEVTFTDNILESPIGHGIYILATAHGEMKTRGNRFVGIPKGKFEMLDEAPPDQFSLQILKIAPK